MKQLNYHINLNTGQMVNKTENRQLTIQEFESLTTRLLFRFSSVVKESDKLYIFFPRATKTYHLVKQSSNQYYFDLPREILKRGRLEFVIQHYDSDLIEMNKYSPETYLYVTEGLDITNETLESRPDLFAEIIYRLEKLEKAQGD